MEAIEKLSGSRLGGQQLGGFMGVEAFSFETIAKLPANRKDIASESMYFSRFPWYLACPGCDIAGMQYIKEVIKGFRNMLFFNTEGLPAIKAGAARHCITPAVGGSLAGYFHDRIARYVKDELYCHAAVISGDGGRLALVSLDVEGIQQGEVQEARRLVAGRTGIAGENVLIHATHTHTGPIMERGGFLKCDGEWLDRLPGVIASTGEDACGRMKDAILIPARTEAADVGSNRISRMKDGSELFAKGGLGPAGPVDRELVAIRICDMEGATFAVLVNFAQHPDNIGGGTADFYSADWPGQLGRALSAIYGEDAVTVFLNGCCGDVNMTIDHPTRRTGWGLGRNISMGRTLAGLAVAATEQAEPMEENRIASSLEYIDIPYYTRDGDFMAELEAARKSGEGWNSALLVCNEYWTHDGETAHVPVQVLRCGSVAIIGIPGEVFARWGLELKHWSPAPFTLVVEMANGNFNYIPTTDQAQRGAYGARPVLSRALISDGGRMIFDKAQTMLCGLWEQ